MDEGDEPEPQDEAPARCPDDCPNAAAPYCPAHEDPLIYRRDMNNLALAEAYANNAAREMIFTAIENLRAKRKLKEVRVPTRVMDEWVVFTKKVVLDSGEYTAQGEVERRIGTWLDKTREQDWDLLDRIKERYMRFTGGYPPPRERQEAPAAPPAKAGGDDAGKGGALRRPARPRTVSYESDAAYFDDDS